jgi:hypothetical protein
VVWEGWHREVSPYPDQGVFRNECGKMLQMDQLPHFYPSQYRSASAIQNNDGFAARICHTAKRRDIFGHDLALETDQIEVASGFPAYFSAHSGIDRRQENQDDPESLN